MKAKIRFGSIELDVEGDAAEIASLAGSLAKKAGLPLALESPREEAHPDVTSAGDDPEASEASPTEDRLPDARHFFSQHAPTNNREATAVAAYYSQHVAPAAQRRASISKDDLDAIFREAKWKLPKRLDQTLVDTAGAGYIKRVNSGHYELTNVGHNLVIHTLGPSSSAE
jgi:hypothetical protein